MDRISDHVAPSSASSLWADAYEYVNDAWQRSVLYADVMRQRGNQYREHMEREAPGVLSLDVEMIAYGHDLPRPVNYSLMRVIAPAGVSVDPHKRPFVVVDPRAGHGPGIGGFKADSEVGVAVRAGHPCYFIGFLPHPEPEQTVEDVMRAEARFIEMVIDRHPQAEGKPVVIGNCQAGWQVMMTAAMRPELFGPIILAGAPLSYWAGWRGKNPMRYFGGLAGGSWLTAMTSDMGGGQFDGAWLVKNFESLNPANTYWSKQYKLYANVDTEAERYLGFEKWWGGHVYLNDREIQYIVDNLFVGNRLSSATLVTSDGTRIDLRNIRSPIIVFCSKGDNITPPPQALGWITDLYQDVEQVRAHGQTIVYSVHESVGHLGIFVSDSVARKEHQEFTCNIDLIDVLPPGIYQADFRDKTPDASNGASACGEYAMEIVKRTVDDVRKIVVPNSDDERRFAAVKRISEMNLGMYRSFMQPWVRQWFTPQVAGWMQNLHPLRLPYELISDANPLVAAVAPLAEQVREARQPASPDNILTRVQNYWSDAVVTALDLWRDTRDAAVEQIFMAVYGSPLVQNLAGLGGREGPPRKHPGVHPEHRQFMAQRAEELRRDIAQGGLREACVRLLLYVSQGQGAFDARCSFDLIRRMRTDLGYEVPMQTFKDMVRDQAFMLLLDLPRSIKSLPRMLVGASAEEIRAALAHMETVLTAGGSLNEISKIRLNEMSRIFLKAADRAQAASVLAADIQVEGDEVADRPVGEASISVAQAADTVVSKQIVDLVDTDTETDVSAQVAAKSTVKPASSKRAVKPRKASRKR